VLVDGNNCVSPSESWVRGFYGRGEIVLLWISFEYGTGLVLITTILILGFCATFDIKLFGAAAPR
jgi:hypothetical protein